MIRAEQSGNNLPEQLFNLGIIVRKLPEPLVNAPPPVNQRARGSVFIEGNRGFRPENNIGREREQLLRVQIKQPVRQCHDILTLALFEQRHRVTHTLHDGIEILG